MQENAKIIFTPIIVITAEQVSQTFGFSIEKSNQLLSRPDSKLLFQKALEGSLQTALFEVVREISKVPHEIVPVRVDAAVRLPAFELKASVAEE